MRRSTKGSCEKLQANASQIVSSYKKEQVRYDNSRYFAMLRAPTKNISHEQWAEFISEVAVSLQNFHLPEMDNSMEKKYVQILEASFSFVLKRLNATNEQTSSLAICCLKALDKNLENLPAVLKDDDYDALLKHVEWVSSLKDSRQFHKGMSNEELIMQIKGDSKSDEFVLVRTPQRQAVLHA
jgi:hypothetical protein